MHFRQRPAVDSDVGEIALIFPGDFLFLSTDGVYDGRVVEERRELDELMREVCRLSARDICNVVLDRTTKEDEARRRSGEEDLIDDKTVFIVKATEPCCT